MYKGYTINTFLPYPDFYESARCLDYRRLGKQRIESKQIFDTLIYGYKAWSHHPAVKMWAGYERALLLYYTVICEEWLRRGYSQLLLPRLNVKHIQSVRMPEWMGDPAFHASHRSKLLFKNKAFYSQYGWTESDTLPYLWPI